MKNILTVTTFNNHFEFFRRLAERFKYSGYETTFLTNKYSIAREAFSSDIVVETITKEKDSGYKFDPSGTFELAAGSISRKQAKVIISSVARKMELLLSRKIYDYIFLWGGVRIIEAAAADYALNKGVKPLFFELGNFPSKIFADPLGTNAKSLLAKDKSVLGKFSYDEPAFDKWLSDYLEEGLKAHSVPQSKSVGDIDYKKNLLDEFGFNVKGLVQNEPVLTKEKISGKFLRRVSELKYDEVNISGTDYIFYPMQVNKDAQLILNSEVGNIEALKIASEIAKEKGAELFVKPHPAEVEYSFIKKVNELKSEMNFKFVQGNTLELIKNSKMVITINSTVGLQAKLMGKDLRCLGKAFYADFTKEELMKYIQSYLINAEFWSDEPVPEETAVKIIQRADINN